MKKIKLSKNARKAIFFVCCLILAFAFWFIVKCSQLDTFVTGLAEVC